MLPDRLSQLLSAFVDGELSPRQRRAVLRLLKRSPEARRLLHELQDDAAGLRNLPRARLGRNFSQRIVRALGERRGASPRRPIVEPRPAFPTWLGFASAAAVLFLVATASYLYFAANSSPPDTPPAIAATGNTPQPEPTLQGGAGQRDAAKQPERVVAEEPSVVVWALQRLGRWSGDEVARLGRPDGKRPRIEDDPIATPRRDPSVFDVISPRSLLLLNVRDLGEEKTGKQLQHELRRDSACRIELFCLEKARGFARLQAVFQAHGVRLVVDRDAQASLNRKIRTNYIIYAEDLTADELATILREVGREDKKAEAKRQAQFERVIVNALSPADYRELSSLLGIDVKLLQAPPKMDPRRPISDRTAGDVARALEGQGPPRPGPGKPAVKGPERVALVLASNLVRSRSASREVKLFLDGRKERRPGTVQMVLVLRENKG
jgi:hypothetical protein